MAEPERLKPGALPADLSPLFPDDPQTAAYFAAKAEWMYYPAAATVMRQFELAEHVYILVEGAVTCAVEGAEAASPYYVGDTDRPWTPVGWSGLRPPGRYSITVHCRAGSRFIRWPTPDLWRLLYSDPRRATAFVEFLTDGGHALLDAVRARIRPLGPRPVRRRESEKAGPSPSPGMPFDGARQDAEAVIAASPFFREFSEAERALFARNARFLRVRGGEEIVAEGAQPDGLYVLARGRVALSFAAPPGTVMRTMGREGAVLNPCGITRPLFAPFQAAATRDTVLLFLPRDTIARAADRDREFGFVFARRVLWLLSQIFLSTRAQLISEQAENEILAATSLIEQKATELPLRSDLYKVPHLLSHGATRSDGFRTLHGLVTGGTALERGLAAIQLDILKDLERETRFRDRLAFIYERIAGADPASSRAALLQEAADAMQHAFEEVPYVIGGIGNLPQDSGFITIYNHLACHKGYQLPNNFEFTLDSHFVSSILMRRYGMPGIRIIKASDSEEFWHRGYYGRILSIQVSADESRAQRARFYDTVAATLAAATPVVIAPEGTNSTADSWTETSPGPLRPGAFVLALRTEPEPLIVPVALANFDRSIRNNVFAAVIKPPFRMSDHVSNPADRAEVSRFLRHYRSEFRTYVEEASDLAETARTGTVVRADAISNLGRLERLDREYADDLQELEHRVRHSAPAEAPVVFYGSSSFRLWTRLDRDLGLAKALNLGFGGSTMEACAHFFERVVQPHRPSALFLYGGDNDIGNGATPEEIVAHGRALLYKVDQFLPGIPVHILSIKPSPFRAGQMGEIVQANRGLAALCAERRNTRFVDIFPIMLRADGAPDPALFAEDMLHMNEGGYARWAAALRPSARTLEVAF